MHLATLHFALCQLFPFILNLNFIQTSTVFLLSKYLLFIVLNISCVLIINSRSFDIPRADFEAVRIPSDNRISRSIFKAITVRNVTKARYRGKDYVCWSYVRHESKCLARFVLDPRIFFAPRRR